jgi:hypothetical protein
VAVVITKEDMEVAVVEEGGVREAIDMDCWTLTSI